ncbi:Uncharacterised protein [Candidatus Gugararchaeum adminiculabundum]|nr:Uncharacterised protein [Candidatus Gugararchaeum adminiculabundum]
MKLLALLLLLALPLAAYANCAYPFSFEGGIGLLGQNFSAGTGISGSVAITDTSDYPVVDGELTGQVFLAKGDQRILVDEFEINGIALSKKQKKNYNFSWIPPSGGEYAISFSVFEAGNSIGPGIAEKKFLVSGDVKEVPVIGGIYVNGIAEGRLIRGGEALNLTGTVDGIAGQRIRLDYTMYSVNKIRHAMTVGLSYGQEEPVMQRIRGAEKIRGTLYLNPDESGMADFSIDGGILPAGEYELDLAASQGSIKSQDELELFVDGGNGTGVISLVTVKPFPPKQGERLAIGGCSNSNADVWISANLGEKIKEGNDQVSIVSDGNETSLDAIVELKQGELVLDALKISSDVHEFAMEKNLSLSTNASGNTLAVQVKVFSAYGSESSDVALFISNEQGVIVGSVGKMTVNGEANYSFTLDKGAYLVSAIAEEGKSQANASIVIESSLPKIQGEEVVAIEKKMDESNARLDLELKLLTALVLVLMYIAFRLWQEQRTRKG